MWEDELGGMRMRIRHMRELLVQRLKAAGVERDMSFILRQKGMFSYSGLSAAAMQRLRSEFGVYGIDSGRICVAALNEGNLDRLPPPSRRWLESLARCRAALQGFLPPGFARWQGAARRRIIGAPQHAVAAVCLAAGSGHPACRHP